MRKQCDDAMATITIQEGYKAGIMSGIQAKAAVGGRSMMTNANPPIDGR